MIPKSLQETFRNPRKEVKTSKIFEDKEKTIFHREGLFSEQIFGPVKDYECQCGRLKGRIHKGKRCKYCGVLCDSSTLRYTEFGYIKLNIPVIFKTISDYIIKKAFKDSTVFRNLNDLIVYSEQALFFNKSTGKIELIKELKSFFEFTNFNAATYIGTPEDLKNEIILYLKTADTNIDEKRMEELLNDYVYEYPVFGIYSLYKLFKSDVFREYFLEPFFERNPKYRIFEDIIFLHRLPVCPPEIRPYIITDTEEINHDITKTLQKIIDVNNSEYFKHMFEMSDFDEYEESIVDIYSKDSKAVRLQKLSNRYFELIEEQFKGKYGKVRQYIHGRTIDFSSRGVVTPSLRIKPYEIEIPYYAAKELLSPHFTHYVITTLQELDDETYNKYHHLIPKLLALFHGVISKQSITEDELDFIDSLFDKFIDEINEGKREFYAILNRPPTLWIYNFLVFNIKVKKDKTDYTIGVHPLFVEQQNMDFDGRQNCRQ